MLSIVNEKAGYYAINVLDQAMQRFFRMFAEAMPAIFLQPFLNLLRQALEFFHRI
jgi:hypothetical protein